jgi:prepilin-type N-terminal cleavage/methylation domain-containing protein
MNPKLSPLAQGRGDFSCRTPAHGFSLVEAVIVLAIMGILASLIVPSVMNATVDSRRIMVRQQQAALNEALNAWVGAQTRDSTTGQLISMATVMGTYTSGYPSNFSKLQAISTYLDPATANDFITGSTSNGDKIQTSAMKADASWITFSTWTVPSTGPTVNLNY